jgi:hypothetical protein
MAERDLTAYLQKFNAETPHADVLPGFKTFAATLFDGGATECCGEAASWSRQSAERFLREELLTEVIAQMEPARALAEAKGEYRPPSNLTINYRPDELPRARSRSGDDLGPDEQRYASMIYAPHGDIEFFLAEAGMRSKLFPNEMKAFTNSIRTHLINRIFRWAPRMVQTGGSPSGDVGCGLPGDGTVAGPDLTDSPFSREHRARFQELRAVGEVFALNLHPEYLGFGPWCLGSDIRGDNAAERLQARYRAAVRKAAISAGAPARIILLDWWICRLAGSVQQFQVEALIQRSLELCEEFEAKSFELGTPLQTTEIQADLRRDLYPIDFVAPHRLYDHPHDPLAKPEAEFDYWREHVWSGITELVNRQEAGLNGGEHPVFNLRRRQPGETRIAFRQRVSNRVSKTYHTLRIAFRCLSYDFGVLLANYVFDRGLKGETAVGTFVSESAHLIGAIERVWRKSSTQLGLSRRKQKTEGIDFKTPFLVVAADFGLLVSRFELADQGADIPEVPAAGSTVADDEARTAPSTLPSLSQQNSEILAPLIIEPQVLMRTPVFRYRYPDDFPDVEQMAIETARQEANRQLDSIGVQSYDDHKAARVKWFWQVVTAGAAAIGRAGASRQWGANLRRETLLDFGLKTAQAAGIAGLDSRGFECLCESAEWHALDCLLLRDSENDTPSNGRGDLALRDAPLSSRVIPTHSSPRLERAFRRNGDVWQITFGGKSVHVRHTKGMTYIVHLLRAPEQEFPGMQLLSAESGKREQLAMGSAGEVLDPTAMTQYQDRIKDLEDKLSEAERNNDQGQKEAAQSAMECLTEQIVAAVGLGGRQRKASDDVERVRKGVSMAVVRAMDSIERHHVEMANHLRLHISCGSFFCYHSDDIPWDF